MQGKKASRDRQRDQTISNRGSDINDIEGGSSQSFVGDSGEVSRKSRKLSSSKRDRKMKNDTDDSVSSSKWKGEMSSRMTIKSGSKESTEDIESYDKLESTLQTKRHRKHHRSQKESGNYSHESTGERDSIEKERPKVRRKKKSTQDAELPIAEILKEDRIQRTKYEEPAPLVELTADYVYVQQGDGFEAIKISGSGVGSGKTSRRSSEVSGDRSQRPIKVAIVFQKIWRSIGFVIQGLLGGSALLHFILLERFFDDSERFIDDYSSFSEIYSSAYSFFITMCIITIFDKFDLAHLGFDNLQDIYRHNFRSFLALPLYATAFMLHQMTLKDENKLTLFHYYSKNLTNYTICNFNDTHSDISIDGLKNWKILTLFKDALAVLAWIFVSFSGLKDMFLDNLEAMNKFEDEKRLPT